MAARIRLKRTGRRNRPYYRICVFDARTRRDGAPVEELGSYDPRARTFEEKVSLKMQRAHYWLTVGAQPSETVSSFFKRLGIRKDEPAPTEEMSPRPVKSSAPASTPAPAPAPAAEVAAGESATATATAEPEGEPAADPAASDDDPSAPAS